MMHNKNTLGFSLVELSVTIVIIGLLMAGITSGLHLLQASKVDKTISELTGYVTAVNNFRDKYKAWPGDMPNASSFWGTYDATTNPNGVIDGNGDERVSWNDAEHMNAWKELGLSGLIAGHYTGQHVAGVNYQGGVNLPLSATPGAIYVIAYYDNTFSTSGNAVQLGSNDMGLNPWGPALPPSDTHAIDMKIDDGLATQGNFYAMRGDNNTNTHSGSNINYNTDGYCVTNRYTAPSADYILSDPAPSCRMVYWLNKQ